MSYSVQLYICQSFLSCLCLLHMLQKIRKIQLREDDIFICPTPKCGTSLIMEIAWLISTRLNTSESWRQSPPPGLYSFCIPYIGRIKLYPNFCGRISKRKHTAQYSSSFHANPAWQVQYIEGGAFVSERFYSHHSYFW